MNIRRIRNDEVVQLQEIAKTTFVETFAAVNSKENIDNYLTVSLSLESLVAELDNKYSEFYVAETGNRIVGYLKLNFGAAQTELKNEQALEIERIYVLKEFHGKKVGQLLYRKAVDVANDKNAEYVWLGVWEENHRAVSFYRKNGFVVFDKHIFKLGDDEQNDLMMKLDLADPF